MTKVERNAVQKILGPQVLVTTIESPRLFVTFNKEDGSTRDMLCGQAPGHPIDPAEIEKDYATVVEVGCEGGHQVRRFRFDRVVEWRFCGEFFVVEGK